MDVVVDKVDKLFGEVRISGSKNAALPIIISTLVVKGKTKLLNVPNIQDIQNTLKIMNRLGIKYEYENNELTIYNYKNKILKNLLFKEMELLRGSSYFWGALLNKRKRLKSLIPGGCKIGSRPFDIHYNTFKKLGINYYLKNDKVIYKKRKKHKPQIITFSKESFGATINTILYSVTGKKDILITNPSLEPEVLDFISYLNLSGASIRILNKQIKIQGVKKLSPIEYKIMFDRIEAGSYMLLSCCFKESNIIIKNINYKYIENIINVIEQLGCLINIENNKIMITRNDELNKLNLIVSTYPSFPTDLQQILCVVLLNTEGVIKDLIFPDRINHVKELKKIKADIIVINNEIVIKKSNLENNVLEGIDLRGTFGLILASGMVNGQTIIKNIDNVLRGYENIIEKLQSINFPIKIIK